MLKAVGDKVKAGEPLFLIEAMKMETTVSSPKDGAVGEVVLEDGALVQQNDVVLTVV